MALLGAASCAGAALLVYAFTPATEAQRAGLALFTLIGGLWLTQALHLTVTALLVPLLAIAGGVLEPRAALGAFAHPVIFVFLGGFALAAALQHHGLDRALATAMLRAARGQRLRAVWMLFALSALLSMWISNTATAALMLPLALGLLADDDPEHPVGPREKAYTLLGVAYSASIGGIGTLVGSPPNAIAAAHAGIGFAEWLRIGLPAVLVLLPVMVAVMHGVLRPRLQGRIDAGRPAEPFEWTRGRVVVVVTFALTALGWTLAAPLGRLLGVQGDVDSLVALAAIVALAGTGATGWRQIERQTQWGVLLLFGGGLALGEAMAASGATAFVADALSGTVGGAPAWLLLAAVVTFVVFLTELVSNTAAAALLVPLFASVAASAGVPPALMAAAIAISASCAFMLPVATPPNALVFGTGQVPAATMMRCGLLLNLACIVVVSVLAAAAFGLGL